MVKKFDRDNYPNAEFLMYALRNLGYTNEAAVADIVDNGFDADADTILVDSYKIPLSTEKFSEIICINIFDNGKGMNESKLDEALKLGSKVIRDLMNELGKFGMGLVTAGISLARKIVVITKQSNSDLILSSEQDIDEIISQKEFVKTLEVASKEEASELNEYLNKTGSSSGTLIKLVNCDGLRNPNLKQFSQKLTREFGRIYKDFLTANKKILINGNELVAADIFMLEKGGEIYSDETYEFKYINSSGEEKVSYIRVKLGILPNLGPQENKALRINTVTQGLYILRNNREIDSGNTLSLFTRHPQMNRFRGEIAFSAELDEKFGITFLKSSVDLDVSIFDKLSVDLKAQIKSISKKITDDRKKVTDDEVDLGEATSHINKKAKLLKGKKGSATSSDEDKSNSKGKKTSNGNNTNEKKPAFEFQKAHLGKVGHIYEVDVKGSTVIITWNIDHVFYEQFILNYQGDKQLSNAVAYLVYSLASAELTISNEETLEAVEEFKNVMSLNLNTLLR